VPWYLHLASDRKTDDWMNDFFPWMRWCAAVCGSSGGTGAKGGVLARKGRNKKIIAVK